MCRYYRSIYYTPSVKADETLWKAALRDAVGLFALWTIHHIWDPDMCSSQNVLWAVHTLTL